MQNNFGLWEQEEMRNSDKDKDRERVKDEQNKKKKERRRVTGWMIRLLKEFRINYRVEKK